MYVCKKKLCASKKVSKECKIYSAVTSLSKPGRTDYLRTFQLAHSGLCFRHCCRKDSNSETFQTVGAVSTKARAICI